MVTGNLAYFASAIAAAAVLILYWAFASQSAYKRKIEGLKARVEAGHGVNREAESFKLSQFKVSLARLFTSLGERFKPKDTLEVSKTRSDLIRAGYRQPQSLVVYYGIKAVFLILPAGAFLLLRMLVLHNIKMQMTFFAIAFLLVLGHYLPKIWLGMHISKRRKEFLYGLPDALDLLVVCVESGMGLDQALFRVGQEIRQDNETISDELRVLNLEQRAGKPRVDALRDLAERVNLDDVTSLITLLVQSEIFGTSVARTLRVYSDTLRTKRTQRAEEQAAKLPVKLLLPLIFFIFPALFVVIGGPAIITLMGLMASK